MKWWSSEWRVEVGGFAKNKWFPFSAITWPGCSHSCLVPSPSRLPFCQRLLSTLLLGRSHSESPYSALLPTTFEDYPAWTILTSNDLLSIRAIVDFLKLTNILFSRSNTTFWSSSFWMLSLTFMVIIAYALLLTNTISLGFWPDTHHTTDFGVFIKRFMWLRTWRSGLRKGRRRGKLY